MQVHNPVVRKRFDAIRQADAHQNSTAMAVSIECFCAYRGERIAAKLCGNLDDAAVQVVNERRISVNRGVYKAVFFANDEGRNGIVGAVQRSAWAVGNCMEA